jgi:hypothetical protein
MEGNTKFELTAADAKHCCITFPDVYPLLYFGSATKLDGPHRKKKTGKIQFCYTRHVFSKGWVKTVDYRVDGVEEVPVKKRGRGRPWTEKQ